MRLCRSDTNQSFVEVKFSDFRKFTWTRPHMAWRIGSSNCKASTEAEIWIFIPAAPNAWKAILLLFKKSPSARSLSDLFIREGYPIPDELSS